MQQVGYVRVSTLEQETRLQVDAMHQAGVTLLFSEHVSSVKYRPQLQNAIAALAGSVLVVWKLDRLARSLRDLLNILERLQALQCGLRSLTEPVDTSTPAGRMMLGVLGAVAQYEREIIRERSIAGQRAARAVGRHPGRSRLMQPGCERELVAMYRSGWYTV